VGNARGGERARHHQEELAALAVFYRRRDCLRRRCLFECCFFFAHVRVHHFAAPMTGAFCVSLKPPPSARVRFTLTSSSRAARSARRLFCASTCSSAL